MDTERPSYFAIIPADVRYDKDLNPNAKLLYGEITCLANKNGYCYATNSFFADLYGVDKATISRWITQLKDKGYIDVFIIKSKDNQIVERRIRISCKKINQKLGGISLCNNIEEIWNTVFFKRAS